MPVPYRKTPRAAEIGLAAYLDIALNADERTFQGGILIIDGKGQPQEFVHNTVMAPSGPLWPEDKARLLAVPMLAHSLFEACRREPDLLVGLSSLGTPDFCATEIAPSIPFAMVEPGGDGLPAEWSWINEPPTSGMRASILAGELARRGFLTEPFDRLWHAMRIVASPP